MASISTTDIKARLTVLTDHRHVTAALFRERWALATQVERDEMLAVMAGLDAQIAELEAEKAKGLNALIARCHEKAKTAPERVDDVLRPPRPRRGAIPRHASGFDYLERAAGQHLENA